MVKLWQSVPSGAHTFAVVPRSIFAVAGGFGVSRVAGTGAGVQLLSWTKHALGLSKQNRMRPVATSISCWADACFVA